MWQEIIKAENFDGQLLWDEPLARHSWFQVGGAVELLFIPNSLITLQKFMKCLPHHVPLLPIGAASNMLVRDGGLKGVAIKLGKEFQQIFFDEKKSLLMAGGAVRDATLAQFALSQSIADLEFYIGIPGTIGGAVAMNAGCFGSETKDILDHAIFVNGEGNIITRRSPELQFAYRSSYLPPRSICTAVAFRARQLPDNTPIREKMLQLKEQKNLNQPMRGKTGGSTFKNPLPQHAWELIDAVGLRGHRIGGAMFSDKHCNFLMNDNHATAKDIEDLGELAIKKVKEKFNIELEWEIKKVGEAL